MRQFPASPGRNQALIEFEPVLLEVFGQLTKRVDNEVRDAMHYALFSVKDRLCVSTAWLIAPRIGVSVERFRTAACALETLRCSLEFKLRGADDHRTKFVEPPIAEAAAYGLIPLAFEMLLHGEDRVSLTEKTELAQVLAAAASPVHSLSALHKEAKILREGARHSLSRDELYSLHQEKVAPVFKATGQALGALARNHAAAKLLGPWFERLGLFSHWVDEFTSRSQQGLSLTKVVSQPEAMDLIKSLETELLERARDMGLRDVAHDVIEPIAETLKTQLQ